MERVFDALPIIHSLWKKSPGCGAPVGKNPVNGERRLSEYPVPYYSLLYPQPVHKDAHMTRLHLHLLSDSTGEKLENIAKAAIAQFDNVETIRSEKHRSELQSLMSISYAVFCLKKKQQNKYNLQRRTTQHQTQI